MGEVRNIDLSDYTLIKEYETYNLYSYKGLYRTCFLKWDIENNRLVDVKGTGSASYLHGALPYITKPQQETRPRFSLSW